MGIIYSIIFSLVLVLPFNSNIKNSKKNHSKIIYTCYGNTPCIACKSCNYCKYCTAGGTCGICAPVNSQQPAKSSSKKPSTSQTSTSTASKQCKATTKAGTRCKRAAKANGYCWQHGG